MKCNNREADLEDWDNERKHLESLLKDRLNFYLVYASLFVIGSLRLKVVAPELYFPVLIIGAVVSFLIAVAVWRTYVLVRQALAKIKSYDHHPYTSLCKEIQFWRYDANHPLLAIPFLMTAFYGYLIWKSWPC